MGFSIGFVSFTVSVKSALNVINNDIDKTLNVRLLEDNLKPIKSEVAEIIDRTTNLILETQAEQLKDLELKNTFETSQINVTELSEIQSTTKNYDQSETSPIQLQNSSSKVLSETRADVSLTQNDEDFFETYTHTEYFLIYRYDIYEYSKFKQKLQSIERDLQANEDLNTDHAEKQKLQRELEIIQREEKSRVAHLQDQREKDIKSKLLKDSRFFREDKSLK